MSTRNWDGNVLICRWNSCGRGLTNPELLYDHIRNDHVGSRRTENPSLVCRWEGCWYSPAWWWHRSSMARHVIKHVPWKPCKFQLCGKLFKRLCQLNQHMKWHHTTEYALVNTSTQLPLLGSIARQPSSTQQQPVRSSTSAKKGTGDWKKHMDKDTITFIHRHLVMLQRKMKEPDYDLTASESARIVLKALKASRLKGASVFRRHLKRRVADDSVTWRSLMDEFD